MKLDIYTYENYKDYVNDYIASSANGGRGLKKKIAEELNCQNSFVTHVLSGNYDFSSEQALDLCGLFNLNEDETAYFLQLLSCNRAGTAKLKKYYQQKLKSLRENYKQIKKRVQIEHTISDEIKAQYYSHWSYSAVHMGLTIPELRTVEALSQRIGLKEKAVLNILNFLLANNLAYKDGIQYRINSKTLFHLDKSSPFISLMHSSWRTKAIESLSDPKERDLHYSLAFTCARADIDKLQNKILKMLEEMAEIIKPSPEEEVAFLCVDFINT